MSALLRPVGPQPSRVYWVRRLVVLVIAVALVTVLAVAIRAVADGAGGATAAGAENPGTETSSAEEPAPDADDADGAEDAAEAEGAGPAEDPDAEPVTLAGGPVACDPAALTVTLAADAASYAAGSQPVFTVALTNTGTTACTVDGGSGNQVVTVTSGADRIWSSSDCQGEAEERLLLLDPGAQDAVELPWTRARSDEACTAGLPEPRPGTYQAVAQMLGAQSAPVVFDLG